MKLNRYTPWQGAPMLEDPKGKYILVEDVLKMLEYVGERDARIEHFFELLEKTKTPGV